MKSRIASVICLLSILSAAVASELMTPVIIPQPYKLERREGAFKLGPDTRIYADSASQKTARLLADQLRKSTGFRFPVSTRSRAGAVQGGILLTTRDARAELGTEGYQLAVAADSVVIRAPAPTGMFYGMQTLLQLLPPEVFGDGVIKHLVAWEAPCVEIEDFPRFRWRGLMLDVSRHFFNKDEVKRILDEMAMHKLNTFHWHLVDDQGWRIEIKKYPQLTRVGAWRKESELSAPRRTANNARPENTQPEWMATTAYGPDGRYGGYYTQADIREVVAYAATRHITVVPEIEMPGHSTAALAACPQFSCAGGPFSTDIKAGVQRGVYCAGNDQTFAFLEGVLTEVFRLFPGKYIHIGGDEVPKDNWKSCAKCQARIRAEGLKNEEELQSYFIRRIEKFVNSRGHTLMGWSEILQGGLAQNATVMDWIGGGAEAARSGHDAVMTPTKFCYFDYYQSTNHTTEPRAIGGFLPLEQVYQFEPIPANLAPQFQQHILGGQCNIWTEYIASRQHAEFMAFPRACALAEVTWSPAASRNWDDFQRRLRIHTQRLGQFGINYRPLTPSAP